MGLKNLVKDEKIQMHLRKGIINYNIQVKLKICKTDLRGESNICILLHVRNYINFDGKNLKP